MLGTNAYTFVCFSHTLDAITGASKKTAIRIMMATAAKRKQPICVLFYGNARDAYRWLPRPVITDNLYAVSRENEADEQTKGNKYPVCCADIIEFNGLDLSKTAALVTEREANRLNVHICILSFG
jgi:hypothetical protein